MIPLPKILCRKNTSARHAAKNAQVIDKNQLVYDRYARHLFCANLPDHNVV